MRRKRVPSTRIAGFEVGTIEGIVENLMDRHLTVDPFPLTSEETLQLWTAGMPRKEFLAWNSMQAWLLADDTAKGDPPIKEVNTQSVPLEFGDGAKLALEVPADLLGEVVWQRNPSIFIKPETVLPLDRAATLEAWARRDVHVRYLVLRSMQQLNQVTRLANTAGQLTRMAPDLVRYTSKLTQTAMQAQERQSALPDAWMQIDRQGLQQALDHLGLCYLISEKDNDPERAGRVPHAWTRNHSQSLCGYRARLSEQMTDQLFSYVLPPPSAGLANLGQFIHGK
jgi:hypothetical protein